MVDWSNKEFVLSKVTKYGYALDLAHRDLKKDREIVLAAVTQCEFVLCYAHEDLKNDEEFLYEAEQVCKLKIKFDSYIFRYISQRIQSEIKENPDYLLDFEPVYLKPCKK
jgi:hypothetical protein